MRLKFGFGFHGRVHITEANDYQTVEDPLTKFKVGQTLTARVVEKVNQSETNRKNYQWELSIKSVVLSSITTFKLASMRSVTNIESKYRVGERVVAKILKVDTERHRISLGMRESYLTNDSDDHELLDQYTVDSTDDTSAIDDSHMTMQTIDTTSADDVENGSANGIYPDLAYVESRASIPPLGHC